MSSAGHGSANSESYFKRVLKFYFAPVFQSFFSVLYFLFFFYFLLFYFDNLLLAIRFVLYTFSISTVGLGLSHLIWGAMFLVALIVPFGASLCALIIPHEMKERIHDKKKKVIVIVLLLVATADVIVLADRLTRHIEQKPPVVTFLQKYHVPIKPPVFYWVR